MEAHRALELNGFGLQVCSTKRRAEHIIEAGRVIREENETMQVCRVQRRSALAGERV